MIAYSMKEICANCRMKYGRHQLVGDWCPVRGKSQTYGPTKFKLKRAKKK